MRKLMLICNPHAGKGISGEKLLEMTDFFNASGFLPEIYFTKKDDDLKEVLNFARDEEAFLVCMGGDGMINLLADAMIKNDMILPFGYLPEGTTNDFAKSTGIPVDFKRALSASVSEEMRETDVGSLSGRHFVYVAGFGLFTDVSYKTPQKTKNAFGYLAYVLEGAMSIAEFKLYRLKITVDHEEVIEGEFILGMVTNSMSVAGMKSIAYDDTRLDDGMFEMLLLRKASNIGELSKLLSSVMAGNTNSPLIVYRQGRHFLFEGEELSWTIDGEYGGTYSRSEIEVTGKKLKLRFTKS